MARENEAAFRLLFMGNPLPMWVYDLETLHFLEVNDAAVKYYGYSRDEFQKLRLTDIRPTEDIPLLDQNLSQVRPVLDESGPWRHRLKDGRIIQVHISSHILEWNGRKSALVVAQDITERKRTEESLKASEARFRRIAESNMIGVTVGNSTGQFTYVNDAYLRMVGYTRDDFAAGRLRWDVITPPDQSHIPLMIAKQLDESGMVAPIETDHLHKDGRRVPVLIGLAQVAEEKDEAIGFVLDVTERKQAEAKLLESERQLRLIFDQIPAAVWTVDKELRIRSASGSALAPAHLDAKDLIGKTSQEFFGTDDIQVPPLAAHLAALKGETRSYQYSMGNSIFSVNVQPLRLLGGEISGVIGVALDVTETKRIAASNARLAAIIESTQDAVIGAASDGRINSWNRGAEQMFGYSAREILGQHLSILVPGDRVQEVRRILEELYHGKTVRPFETLRLRKDGTLVDVSITLSIVKDTTGRVIGTSAIAHDLKDRKEIERELKKLSARLLKVQDEAQRNLARELHDSVIQGLAATVIKLSIVKDSANFRPGTRATLEEALKMTEQAVREIRTFSYLLHPPLLDERGLPSALRWYVEGYNNRSEVQVELDLPERQDRLDKEVELALFRIVQEALTNITRHSGGHYATISMRQTPRDLILVVSDDGHGMDPQTLEKVKREGAALGVGIAGMKERTRQFGGRLDISSSNRGTAVTVTLPIGKLR